MALSEEETGAGTFFFFTPHLITFGSTSPPTFLFLVVRTWNGWICFFSRSQATASVSRTQDTTESVFTCGTKDRGENQRNGEREKKKKTKKNHGTVRPLRSSRSTGGAKINDHHLLKSVSFWSSCCTKPTFLVTQGGRR